MTPVEGGLIALFCASASVLLGMLVSRHLPPAHLSPESKDVIKVAAALIGTLSALVLGMLTATAKSSFDDKIGELRHAAAQTIVLDRLMADYGAEAKEARDQLHQLVEARLRQLWTGRSSSEAEVSEAIGRGLGIEAVKHALLDLSPRNNVQQSLWTSAVAVCDDIALARWTGFLETGSSIRWPFVAILVFWISTIFASFGLLAPRNATVLTLLFVGALSVSGSIFLILQLDQPFGGLIRLPSGPAEMVLNQLGRP